MRKFGLVLLALVSLSFLALPALAAPGEITFGLTGGMTVPMGDYGDATKSGATGGVFGDYMLSDMFAVGLDAAYSQNKGKDLPAGVDAKVTILQFGAHVKLVPPMKDMPISPYLQVGAGLYNGKTEVSAGVFSSDTTVNKFGFNVGVGADYKVSPMVGVGLFGAYHNVTDAFEDENGDTKSATYVAVGVKVSFMTAAKTAGAAK
jgi:opacity protein-like surface antigen